MKFIYWMTALVFFLGCAVGGPIGGAIFGLLTYGLLAGGAWLFRDPRARR